jgi:hypothetical protein
MEIQWRIRFDHGEFMKLHENGTHFLYQLQSERCTSEFIGEFGKFGVNVYWLLKMYQDISKIDLVSQNQIPTTKIYNQIRNHNQKAKIN